MSTNCFAGICLRPNFPPIHSLLVTDDPLVCGQATIQEAIRMKNVLHEFCIKSGKKPNWAKSRIIFSKNVPISTIHSIKKIFQVHDIDNNFIHLGHHLIIPGNNRTAAYNFVCDKFKSKLSMLKQINFRT
jgi:hypothetical protein